MRARTHPRALRRSLLRLLSSSSSSARPAVPKAMRELLAAECVGVRSLPKDTIMLDGASPRKMKQLRRHLEKGGCLCVRDCYNSALRLYLMLKRDLLGGDGPSRGANKRKNPSKRTGRADEEDPVEMASLPARYSVQRQKVRRFRALASSLFIPASRLRGLPRVEWLDQLIEEKQYGYLSLRTFLGVNSAWERHKRGVKFPSLSHRVHPLYNVFCPPEHATYVKLFDEWLGKNRGAFQSAIDIGCGSGVLTFLMLKHGIPKVLAVDSNAVAIASLAEDLDRVSRTSDYSHLPSTPAESVEPRVGDLFAGLDASVDQCDLVVFNPPWLPGEDDGNVADSSPAIPGRPLEQAIFSRRDLLRSFLATAKTFARKRVTLLYSDLALQLATNSSGIGNDSSLTDLMQELGFKLEKELSMSDRKNLKALMRRQTKYGSVSGLSQSRVQLWELSPPNSKNEKNT